MKRLKDILRETSVAAWKNAPLNKDDGAMPEPRAGGEKAFKAQHTTQKHAYPVDVEAQFKGSNNPKTFDREAHRMGKNPVLEAKREGWKYRQEPYSLEAGKVGQPSGPTVDTPLGSKRNAMKHLHQIIKKGASPGYHSLVSPKGEKMAYNQARAYRTKKV